MIIRFFFFLIFALAYILFTLFQDKIEFSSIWKKVISIILTIIVIPWTVSEVTGFRAFQTTSDLKTTIISLTQKVENQSDQLISQDMVLRI